MRRGDLASRGIYGLMALPPPERAVAPVKENVERNMEAIHSTMAGQVAEAARAFQRPRPGHAPTAVSVAISNDTLVISLHEALTPAERALAESAEGAAKVQEFHRQLFANSADSLRENASLALR